MNHRIYIRNSFVAFVLLLICCSIVQADEPNNVNLPVTGEEFRFVFQEHEFLLFLPLDYNDMNKAPLMLYYADDPPNIGYPRYFTKSKGFIIIGMAYANEPKAPVTKGKHINYIKGEVKRLGKLKTYLQKELGLRIDEHKIFALGRSRGGWLLNDVFEYRPQAWGGVAIVSAGRRSLIEPAPLKNFRGKPVYIGAGEFDVNLKAAKRANAFLRKAGADVTFEMYEGLGHAMDTQSAVFWQWIQDRKNEKD